MQNSEATARWTFRAPPIGLSADEYTLCDRKYACDHGATCIRAHSDLELAEWRERDDSKQKLAQKLSKRSNTLADTINIQLQTGTEEKSLLKNHIEGVSMYSDNKTVVALRNKTDTASWIFNVTAKEHLQAVTLLEKETAENFSIQSITRSVGQSDKQSYTMKKCAKEWANPSTNHNATDGIVQAYRIKVTFKCTTYGTYKQRLVFSFLDQSVYLCRDLKVTVCLEEVAVQATDLSLTESKRWESLSDVQVMRLPQLHADCEDELMLQGYRRPDDMELCVQRVVDNANVTPANYKLFYHALLYIEEAEQFHQLSKFALNGIVKFSKSFTTESVGNDTTHYARPEELFGRLPLGSKLSEDTLQGRILLKNVTSLLLTASSQTHPNKVFECELLERGKDFIVFKVTSGFIEHAVVAPETCMKCQVQFVVNRMAFCEMHSVLDGMDNVGQLYPGTAAPKLPWAHLLNESLEQQTGERPLNHKQREGLLAATCKADSPLPPVLLIGPFGTGKTLTLASSVISLLDDDSSRILICTHSNSAADLYVKDYMHPFLTRHPHRAVKVLRIYYKHRFSTSVPPVVKKYSLLTDNLQSFRTPTIEDLVDAKVVVVTLATCFSLTQLGLPKGFFTHIMVDEAAQAMELETIIPISLADENTRIILAGDHMQMNPEVCSQLARKYNLHGSLFDRLAHTYPHEHCCKVTLNVNYRSHPSLVKYSSDLFYDGKLKAFGKQAVHPIWYPLTFLAARGESAQPRSGTGYYNLAEVYETVDFVYELVNTWPTERWGRLDDNSIGVVLPYSDQVTMLRSVLREKDSRLRNVSVERVFNVQGKQFRVVVINTVRTHHSCYDINEEEADYGFLSNPRLLNTAVTRAQSLTVIIGDPFSLCSVGKCRNLWIRFLEQCAHNKSLYGATFAQIQDYIDYMDIGKAYKLNPGAEEFVPTNLEEKSPTQLEGEPETGFREVEAQQHFYAFNASAQVGAEKEGNYSGQLSDIHTETHGSPDRQFGDNQPLFYTTYGSGGTQVPANPNSFTFTTPLPEIPKCFLADVFASWQKHTS